MLGAFNDAWFRYVEDIGPAGPDKGKGGKYLVLPPDYEGEVPTGYFVVRPRTYDVWAFMRASIAKGLEAAEKNVKDNLRIYPLSKKGDPPKMEYFSGSGKSFNTIHANDYTFYEHLNEIVQKEPLDMLDPETRGLLASIGMEKGKPFKPDQRMKKILTDAVAIANATARSIVWYPRTDGTMKGIRIYPDTDSAWIMGFLGKNVFFNGEDGKTMNSDARVMFHYPYTAVTPAMALTRAGAGSDYAIAYVDSKKQPFDGSNTYRLRIPPNPPVKDFWALTMYDNQTRSQLQTSQRFPTVGSQTKGIKQNSDGSYDIYFAPKPPKGYENNWLETVPGKGWFVALRMYGPLKPGSTRLGGRARSSWLSNRFWHRPGRYRNNTSLVRDFFEFLAIAKELSPGRVEVWSNGYREEARRMLSRVRTEHLANVCEATIKPGGTMIHTQNDFFVAPVDFGVTERPPCHLHSFTGAALATGPINQLPRRNSTFGPMWGRPKACPNSWMQPLRNTLS